MLLIGARPYPLQEGSAVALRDVIREFANHERPLSYLADAIGEDLAARHSPEPIELGRRQIEALADLLWNTDDDPLRRLHTGCERHLHQG